MRRIFLFFVHLQGKFLKANVFVEVKHANIYFVIRTCVSKEFCLYIALYTEGKIDNIFDYIIHWVIPEQN